MNTGTYSQKGPRALLRQGLDHQRRGELGRAEALYRAALAAEPDNFDALHMLGVVHLQRGDVGAALDLLSRAVAVAPGSARAQLNLGLALHAAGRSDEALDHIDQALALKPDYHQALYNRAALLIDLYRFDEVRQVCDRLVGLVPGDSPTWINLGDLLRGKWRWELAIACYRNAVQLNPGDASIRQNLANLLYLANRHDEAIEVYREVLAAEPGRPWAFGGLLRAKLRICDWQYLDAEIDNATADVRAGRPTITPFTFLAISESPADQLQCARTYVQQRILSADVAQSPCPQPYLNHKKVRVAYLSADFHDHATARLMAGVFESHDRERFETRAISFGPDDGSPMRDRLVAAFDDFRVVRRLTDERVANLLRELEVDIAVDLKGHTQDSRPGILARRPCPVQVGYLGYPGTTGAPYMDYIIADPVVIPAEDRRHYSEQVVWLQGSYQPNDRERLIAASTPDRAAHGLPVEGFVFCSFTGSYKINPAVFDVWMRLLQAVPGSVLWLLRDSDSATRNLQRQAHVRGVDADRLVFADSLNLPEHLARHRHADLALDTWPVGSHTTASDALWAGLPVLTRVSSAFPGRVAASLLGSAGLPELVSHSTIDYEARALQLATDPGRLTGLRARLIANRDTCALFDSDRTRRQIESAYLHMVTLRARGVEPSSFQVLDDGKCVSMDSLHARGRRA